MTDKTFSITTTSIQAATRKLSARWTFELNDKPIISQLDDLRYSIMNHPESLEWLGNSGLDYELVSDDHPFPIYNVTFKSPAGSALFKLTFM